MKDKPIRIITNIISVLTLISCIISISNNGIYRDGAWANAQWLGQDFITLIIALPLLWIAQFQSIQKKRWKWRIILSGVLFYYSYTYAFYMFAAKLTFLYLFHLPIFGLSVIGLFIILIDLFSQNLILIHRKLLTVRIVTGYLVLISLMLVFLWFTDIISHLLSPDYTSDTPDGEAPLIIYSLDLALIIPLMIVSAVGCWYRKQFGYILAGIMLTKTSTLGFALMGMSLSMYIQEENPDSFLIFLWSIIGIFGTILTVIYLKQLDIEGSDE